MTDLADVARASVEAALSSVCVSVFGIVSRSNGDGTVDVTPLVRRRVRRADGTDAFETWPTLPSVPLLFPGGGLAAVAWTPTAGDRVLVVFSDEDPSDAWLTTAVADPRGAGRHDPSHGFAVPLASAANIAAAEFVALASKVDAAVEAIKTAYSTHTHPVPALGTSGVPTVPTITTLPTAGKTRTT